MKKKLTEVFVCENVINFHHFHTGHHLCDFALAFLANVANPKSANTMYSLLGKKVKVYMSRSQIAGEAVWGLKTHCILGTAKECRSPSPSFRCLILPYFEKGIHLMLGWQRVFQSAHGEAHLKLKALQRLSAPWPNHSNYSTTASFNTLALDQQIHLAYIILKTQLFWTSEKSDDDSTDSHAIVSSFRRATSTARHFKKNIMTSLLFSG